MKRTLTAAAGFCVGLSLLAPPAMGAGPDHAQKTHAHDGHAEKTLEDYVGKVELPELFIGSKAPELKIAKYVKGDSVQGFEKGKVYVVEFWATWCGPCIRAFPHLSEMQAHYGDKVQFVGVNVWEGVEDPAERIKKVEEFVSDQGDRMSYTVAVEDGTAMADTWMKPAAQSGIPAAFIVSGEGNIAWIGHPMSMDEPLEQIVGGGYDNTAAIEEFKRSNLMMAGYRQFMTSMQAGEDLEDATAIAKILVDDYLGEEPGGLNAVAWVLLNGQASGEAQFKLAKRSIGKACELTQWKDWTLLDTYALAAHKSGDNAEAIKWQQKAIELAPASNTDARAELEAKLDQYKSST